MKISTLVVLLIFVPVLALILLALNLFLAPTKVDEAKLAPYECGFSPVHGQTRSNFSIHFYIVAMLFLVFDLEILLLYPYVVSAYTNGIYGLVIALVFSLVLTLGFAFELGKNALKIESRQVYNFQNKSWKGYSVIYS